MNKHIITLIAVLAILLSACGGNEPQAEPQPAPTVYVTVEPEPDPTSTTVAVPNVTGMTQLAATQAIKDEGLGVRVLSSAENVAVGTVSHHSPSTGEQVEPASLISIYVRQQPYVPPAPPAPPVAAPGTYGSDVTLDQLQDRCGAGDQTACDDLFWQSPLGSEYESFARGHVFGVDGEPMEEWMQEMAMEMAWSDTTPDERSSVCVGVHMMGADAAAELFAGGSEGAISVDMAREFLSNEC